MTVHYYENGTHFPKSLEITNDYGIFKTKANEAFIR